MDLKKSQIIFFDGVCNLCNAYVDFLVRHDKRKLFYFASLQGETAKMLLAPAKLVKLDSIILYQEGRLLERSTAVLTILSELGFPWRLLQVFMIVPRPLRDFLYRLVAQSRYSVFGKRESCRLPTDAEQGHFLK